MKSQSKAFEAKSSTQQAPYVTSPRSKQFTLQNVEIISEIRVLNIKSPSGNYSDTL
jgi:hypothetical protein